MAASDPASWHAHTWSDPAASFTSFFAVNITNFPAIRRRTSPTTIGGTPGFLFSGINRLAVKASKLLSVSEFERCMFVLHNRFTKFAMDVRSSKGLEPNWLETKILRQLSASSPDRPHPPLVFIAALFTKSYRCLHKQYCVFVFLGFVIWLRGELVVLLDVSDSEYVKIRRKVVVFHCSYHGNNERNDNGKKSFNKSNDSYLFH